MQKTANRPAVHQTKAIAYVRASGKTAAPAADHEQSFAAFCARLGYHPAASFVEKDGLSSVFADLVDAVRREGAGVVVAVPSLEAFGAKTHDPALALLELESLGAKVQLMATGQAVDLGKILTSQPSKMGKPPGLAERITSAMYKRAVKGEGLGKPPYGYRIGQSRKLEIHEAESEAVKTIFHLYTQRNVGIRLIARHLNEHNVPTRRGGKWSMVTIRDILRNRAYLGTYTRFGVRVPGSHPAIITPDMFRWAQNKLEERKPRRKNGQAEPYVLSGLIYCGYCNNRMVGVTRKQSWTRRKDGSRKEKQYRYYQCQSRTNQSVCQYHTHRSDQFESNVLTFLGNRAPELETMQEKRAAPSAAALQKERQRLETARARAERKLRQLLRLVASGKLPYLRFKEMGDRLIAERREAQDGIRRMAAARSSSAGTSGQQAAQAIRGLLAGWSGMDTNARRALLNGLIEKIIVFDDRTDIHLRAA
ncbi:MAG: hypothetical protein FJ039_10290 [Chloroflexi bacterium]|nr:hypothetical protein [Chloroflexota bacterium]